MDDLKMLGTLLATPDPSRDAFDRGRHQLQQTIRRPVRRHRAAGLGAGIGLTAAAAAATVVASVITAPTPAPSRPHAAARPSSQQILLAAANSAAQAPTGSGTYWYVKTVISDSPSDHWETWTKRDGETWLMGAKTGGKIFKLPSPRPDVHPRPGHFALGGAEVSFEQLNRLPTGTAALKTLIVTNAAEQGSKYGGPTSDPILVREATFDALTALVSDLPTPPKVRAAAFRVMATLPGVQSIGPVKGGQGLLISLMGGQQARLVVDPATSRVRDTNFFVTSEGAEFWVLPSAASATITAGWTNQLPK
jgi:hypothetical protein